MNSNNHNHNAQDVSDDGFVDLAALRANLAPSASAPSESTLPSELSPPSEPSALPVSTRDTRVRGVRWLGGAVLLGLIGLGGWFWMQSQKEESASASAPESAAEQDEKNLAEPDDLGDLDEPNEPEAVADTTDDTHAVTEPEIKAHIAEREVTADASKPMAPMAHSGRREVTRVTVVEPRLSGDTETATPEVPAVTTETTETSTEPEPEPEPKTTPRDVGALLAGATRSDSNTASAENTTTNINTNAQQAVNLPETPSRAQVRRALSRVTPAVRRCAAEKTGVAMVRIQVASSGTVRSASVGGAAFAGSAEAACMERVIRGARFPPFTQATFNVTYPFAIQQYN